MIERGGPWNLPISLFRPIPASLNGQPIELQTQGSGARDITVRLLQRRNDIPDSWAQQAIRNGVAIIDVTALLNLTVPTPAANIELGIEVVVAGLGTLTGIRMQRVGQTTPEVVA